MGLSFRSKTLKMCRPPTCEAAINYQSSSQVRMPSLIPYKTKIWVKMSLPLATTSNFKRRRKGPTVHPQTPAPPRCPRSQ